jgi:O-antigen ligase
MAGALVVAATATLRRRTAARLAVAVTLMLVAFAAVQVSKSPQRPLSVAASIRVELARTGLRMFAANPLFGVGVGRYYAVSGEFSSPQLLRTYLRENAHNNFLQILAELGIVGFGAFAWLLLAVGRRIWRARTEGGLSPPAWARRAGRVSRDVPGGPPDSFQWPTRSG